MSSHHHHNHIHSTNHQEVRMPTTRKRRRGMIEKRRRDKINNSLSELRRLVPTANEKQNSSKLEKAEILQLTVDYLRSLHARGIITDTISNGRLPLQNSDSNQTDSTTILSSSNTSTLLASPDPLQSQQPSSTMDPTNQQQLNQGNILMRSPQPQSQHQQLQHGAQQIHQTTSSTSPSQASSLSENIHDNQTLSSLQQYSAAAAAAAVLSSDQHQGGLNVVSAPVNHHPIEYLAYNQQHHHHHHHAQMSAAAAYHQHSQQQQHQQHHANHPQQHLPQQQHHQHPHQVTALNNRHSSMKMESHNPFQSPLVLPHTHSSLLNLDHHHHHQSHHHNPLAYSSHHHHHPSYHNATFSAAPSSATN